jgi:CheY-like chemotaxis protein
LILVVDDSVDIVDWMKMVIEEAGYYFDSARDGFVASTKLGTTQYALVLIDISLPGGISGYDLAEVVRALPGPASETPLVAITGGFFDDSRKTLFSALLKKPFLPRELRAVITQFARPPSRDR